MTPNTDIIQQQIDYYRARAAEYDQWFYRQGRYDHGETLNRQWLAEADTVRQALHQLPPTPNVLELACGTGIWTQALLKRSEYITAIDAAAEVIEINRYKLKHNPGISYLQDDLFAWEPAQAYDLVFFSFWLSHVPADKLDPFLDKVRRATRPGGRLFIIDSRLSPSASAHDHALQQAHETTHRRRLNDGREFDIVKVYYTPDDLRATLATHGFEATVYTTPNYFIYASGVRLDTNAPHA